MKKIALITGGSSGIGQALAKELAEKKLETYIVGRRLNKLEETKKFLPEYITAISADISTVEGRKSIAESLSNKQIHYLVHNAAVIEPLKTFDSITLEEWRQHSAVNLEGPLFLTQLLLSNLTEGSRILNISSGLAHRALPGTDAYSISKAGLYMLYQIWNKELSSRGILAGSIQPGVVNTDMQATLRSEKEFINYKHFQSIKTENRLLPPQKVAKILTWMLLEMPPKKFIEKDWRIEELLTKDLS